MKKKTPCCVALVDKTAEFLYLQYILQPLLSPNPILGFRDLGQFYRDMLSHDVISTYRCLIVVADSSALEPSREGGVFYQTFKKVENFRGVVFTADPKRQRKQWDILIKEGVIKEERHIINRKDFDSIVILSSVLLEIIDELDNAVKPKVDKISDTAELMPSAEVNVKETETGNHKELIQIEEGMTINDLIKPGTYIYNLVTKDKLHFWERFILYETAWYALVKMKKEDPEHFNKYLQFVEVAHCSEDKRSLKDKPGICIVVKVVKRVVKR